jgi:hypothetical protein
MCTLCHVLNFLYYKPFKQLYKVKFGFPEK